MATSTGDQGTAANRSATKRVRMTEAEAELLARLARQRDMNESQVLRHGVRLQERMQRRAQNIGSLLDLIEGPEPEKLRFELGG